MKIRTSTNTAEERRLVLELTQQHVYNIGERWCVCGHTVSIRVGARRVETLDSTGLTEGVPGNLSVKGVCGQIIGALGGSDKLLLLLYQRLYPQKYVGLSEQPLRV